MKMQGVKQPPIVHTSFNRSEFLIGQLSQRGIETAWSFLDSKAKVNDWLIRGESINNRIDIFFHPFLFDPVIPDPYTYGDDIDIVTAAIISHEAGHILDATPQKYVAGQVRDPDFSKLTEKTRVLIFDVEKQAWKLGELLLLTCCIQSPDFDENFNWDLFHDLKAYCLSTYKKGMELS